MGRSYSVPRNVKGETRILIIFTVKSFLTTALGAGVGAIGFFLFSMLGLTKIGFLVVGIFAIIGYCMGSLVIPDSNLVGIFRKAGGEQLGDIFLRTLNFWFNKKKIFVYREGGKNK